MRTTEHTMQKQIRYRYPANTLPNSPDLLTILYKQYTRSSPNDEVSSSIRVVDHIYLRLLGKAEVIAASGDSFKELAT